jgi:hypothetical protein
MRDEGEQAVRRGESRCRDDLGERADQRRRHQGRQGSDRHHRAQEQPQPERQPEPLHVRTGREPDDRRRGRRDQHLGQLAPADDRRLHMAVGQRTGQPGKKHVWQRQPHEADGHHQRHVRHIDQPFAEADRQPLECVVVEEREATHDQQRPEAGRRTVQGVAFLGGDGRRKEGRPFGSLPPPLAQFPGGNVRL